MPASASTPRPVGGVTDTSIDPARLYRADDLCLRMAWKPAGWRAARRAGLVAHKCGKRFFVLGADLIRFVLEHREAPGE